MLGRILRPLLLVLRLLLWESGLLLVLRLLLQESGLLLILRLLLWISGLCRRRCRGAGLAALRIRRWPVSCGILRPPIYRWRSHMMVPWIRIDPDPAGGIACGLIREPESRGTEASSEASSVPAHRFPTHCDWLKG